MSSLALATRLGGVLKLTGSKNSGLRQSRQRSSSHRLIFIQAYRPLWVGSGRAQMSATDPQESFGPASDQSWQLSELSCLSPASRVENVRPEPGLAFRTDLVSYAALTWR